MEELDDYSLIKAEYKAGYRVARLFVGTAWFVLVAGLAFLAFGVAGGIRRIEDVFGVLWILLATILSFMLTLASAAVLRAVLDTAAATRAALRRGRSAPCSVGGTEVDFFTEAE